MGKLVNSLLLIVAMEMAMVLFLGISSPTTSLYSMFSNPEIFLESSLLAKISATLTLVAAVGIVIGAVVTQYDFLVFGGLSLILLSYGATFFEFYQKINSIEGFGAETYISLIIIVPIVIIYGYTILKFWRGSD